MPTNEISRELRLQSRLIGKIVSELERLIELRTTPERRALLRALRAEASKLNRSRRLLEGAAPRVQSIREK